LPSTPSSTSAPDDSGPRSPSRTAIALLVVASIAIPAVLLALILTRDTKSSAPAAARGTTPTAHEQPTDKSKAKVGTPAPDFTLPSTTGKTVRLSDLRGHPVVLAFYASWCHPCEEELPVLQEFANRDGDRLRVIGVNFRDLASDSAAFIRRLHVTYPALVDDPSAPTGGRYGVRGIPQTIFIDSHGVVRGRVYGQTSSSALQPAIDDLLAGRNIRPI
jgi:cytochrome c biogenesis protein CcmG/thiol:disulfide interchange protein DsbE